MRDIIRATSCTDAWLQATTHLRAQADWRDYNLALEISRPMSLSAAETKVHATVEKFLDANDKYSISTVINTIFPAALYKKYGAKGAFNKYRDEIAPKLKRHPDIKWGTYFMRMTSKINGKGEEINPLEYLIAKLRRAAKTSAPKRAVYELNLIEPFLDIPIYDGCLDKHYHMGGPCLSHLSFKLNNDKKLLLTALYRSHYYIERALGNLFGLAMLQDFVASESGTKTAELVCISTMAKLDTDGLKKRDVTAMLDQCNGYVTQEKTTISN
jgi:hypothetical protein